MKIIFFGSSSFVLPVLHMLHQNHHLSLTVTTERLPQDPVPAFCITNQIPYLSVDTLPDPILQEKIAVLKPDVAVLAAFGLIIPDMLLSAFPFGILNIHPSLLPLYRGPTPVQTVIRDNIPTTGVTIIRLDSELDHGPILAQEKVTINPSETAHALHLRLFEKGATLLHKVLPSYLENSITLQKQDHSKATYTNRLSRNDGFVDISKPINPTQFQQLIKAYYPWPGVWTRIQTKDAKGTSQQMRVKFLPNKMLQFEGKKPINYKDFFNGFPHLKEVFAKVITEKDLFVKAAK